MSIPPRAPIPTTLAGSPKQPDPLREDIRARLASAWSASPMPDIDQFVLNARARNPQLRQCHPATVMAVCRAMGLQFSDSAPTTVAKAAALRGAWSETDLSAPEQARRADAMNTAALAEFNRLQALRGLR
jgi:hypothetical protein